MRGKALILTAIFWHIIDIVNISDSHRQVRLASLADWKTIRSNFCRGMHRGPSIMRTPEIIGKHFYFSVNYNIKKLP